MNFDGRPSDSHLFDQQADELLTLLEIEGIHAVANVLGRGFDLARQPVVDRKFLALCQERLALSLELSMAADHLLMPRLEVGELNGLHLVQVQDSAPLVVGLLQATVQAFELSIEQFIVGPSRSSPECRLALDQDLRLKQGLSHLLPHQRVQLLSLHT